MKEKNVPIQAEESEYPVDEEEGEHVQVRELAQQIEKIVEAMDMELEQGATGPRYRPHAKKI